MFSTISDPSLRVALVAGAAAVALTVTVAVMIIALRLSSRLTERRWQAFVAQWRPLLLAAMLAPEAALLPHLRRSDHGRFLRLWTYLHESVRGDASARLNRVALQLKIDRSALRLLRRGSRAERLQAILAAGYLRDRTAWPSLLSMAASTDGLVSVNAARALIRIDALEGAQCLMPLILARRDWELTRVATFLEDAREAFWLLLIKSLPTLRAADLPRALSLCEALRLQLPVATLRHLLDLGQPASVVGRALRLAAARELVDDVRGCLTHPVAGVRLDATRAMARMGEPGDVPRLVRLLEDKEWPVRLGAAQALSSLPFVSTEQLEQWLEAASSARDVLRHVIAERQWA